MADLTGQRLGAFEIKQLLGTGGFATVYLAHDPRLKCDVAIKILAENHTLNPDIRERFIGEAQALRRIRSKSMIGIHDILATPDKRPYLVLEYADRGPISDRRRVLASNGWYPGPDDVCCVVDSLADALDAVHAEELVHRDVTPSNLLIRSDRQRSGWPRSVVLGPDEQFVLADMSLVKDQSAGSGLTIGGGTIGFAAPEQRQALAVIDHRTDVYSASALTLWFLTGETIQELPEWETELRSQNWSTSFVDALSQGLAVDLEDRHQTIIEWKLDLLGSIASAAPALKGSDRVKPPGDASQGRKWPKYAIGVTAGVVMATGGVSMVVRDQGSESPAVAMLGSSAVSETTTSLGATSIGTPTPEMEDVYFLPDEEDVRLGLAWGSPTSSDGAVGSEIQVAVNGGEWVTELTTDFLMSSGWFLFTTGPKGAVNTKVTADRSYAARVRWILEDGTTTEWSAPLFLEAQS